MTAEEQREQLLKRILPGLAITIIYFVFISGLLSEKMTKAEEQYQNLIKSGVSKEGMSNVLAQQSQTQRQLSTLQAENKKYSDKLKELAGFLSNEGSSNTTATELAKILADNDIKTQQEERKTIDENQLNTALREMWQLLKPAEDPKKTTPADKKPQQEIHVQHLVLKGSYQQLYQAMKTIADSDLQALPVSFTMRMPETDDTQSGELEWELILWM